MTKIELPPLPVWMSRYTVPADDFEGGDDCYLEDLMKEYAIKAIESYAKRIAELEAALQPRPEVVGVTLDGVARLSSQENPWLQDGYVLYRLTDERDPRNCDEIIVTMVDGSRTEEARTRRAGELLDAIRAVCRGKGFL